MTRRTQAGSGRVTQAPVYDPEFDDLPPLRKRNPFKFWMVMLAAAAMVGLSLSTLVAAIFS